MVGAPIFVDVVVDGRGERSQIGAVAVIVTRRLPTMSARPTKRSVRNPDEIQNLTLTSESTSISFSTAGRSGEDMAKVGDAGSSSSCSTPDGPYLWHHGGTMRSRIRDSAKEQRVGGKKKSLRGMVSPPMAAKRDQQLILTIQSVGTSTRNWSLKRIPVQSHHRKSCSVGSRVPSFKKRWEDQFSLKGNDPRDRSLGALPPKCGCFQGGSGQGRSNPNPSSRPPRTHLSPGGYYALGF